jgi:hypothetical protein
MVYLEQHISPMHLGLGIKYTIITHFTTILIQKYEFYIRKEI